MTEQEWMVCNNPQEMLDFLQGNGSERKVRLFAVACCHRIWHLLIDERSRTAVEVAEQFADGLVGNAEQDDAAEKAGSAQHESAYGTDDFLACLAATAAIVTPITYGGEPHLVADHTLAAVIRLSPANDVCRYCELIRDIFENGSQPVAIASAWLTPDVVAIAKRIYDDRRFQDMLVLGHALEEAGCPDAAILNHCRQPGEHTRGCWVVDLILGKK